MAADFLQYDKSTAVRGTPDLLRTSPQNQPMTEANISLEFSLKPRRASGKPKLICLGYAATRPFSLLQPAGVDRWTRPMPEAPRDVAAPDEADRSRPIERRRGFPVLSETSTQIGAIRQAA
jgi:hypothetical protein